MRAAVLYEPQKIVIENRKKPRLKLGEAIIRVKYASICGSDLNRFYYKKSKESPNEDLNLPIVMGHEFCGLIDDIIPLEKTDLGVGDKVVVETLFSCGFCELCLGGSPNLCKQRRIFGVDMDGAFREYLSVPIEKIHKIPNQLKFEEATLIEPLAVSIHAIKKSSIAIGSYVVIIGSGAIGIILTQLSYLAGAEKVIVTDMKKNRLKIAGEFGAEIVNIEEKDLLESVFKITSGRGADTIFEAAGGNETLNKCLSLISEKGEIVIVGIFKKYSILNTNKAILKEAKLISSRLFNPVDFKLAIELLRDRKINIRSLITHRIKFDYIENGFKLMKNGKAIRVLISL